MAAGERVSHMGWEFADSYVPSLPFLSLPPSFSFSLSASPGSPHVGPCVCVLVRADVNACWVAVPDAGFI